MKKGLCLLLAVLMLTALFTPIFTVDVSAAETKGYYTYTVSGGKATITQVGTGISDDVEIPSTLGGYPVTAIDTWAFRFCSKMRSVTIPDSVTTIGDFAFYECSSLLKVTFSNSLTSIGASAFYNCTALQSVQIPDSVKTISERAFYNCASLSEVALSKNTASIGEHAFYSCSALMTVSIPASVKTIGQKAFYYCKKLAKAEIHSTSVSFGADVFAQTATGFTIYGNANSSAQTYASANKHGFRLLSSSGSGSGAGSGTGTTSGGGSGSGTNTSGVVATGDCGDKVKWTLNKDGELVISGTGRMWDYTYTQKPTWDAYKSDIKTITVKKGVTSVGAFSFGMYSSVKKISVASTVTSIGDRAFYYCVSLIEAKFFCKNATFGLNAILQPAVSFVLYGYSGSTAQTYAKDNSYTFEILRETEPDDTVADSRPTIASGTCGTNVKWVLYKDGELVISGTGKMADYNYTAKAPWDAHKNSLKKVTVENGVTGIGVYAFCNMSTIESISLPASVTTIGSYAFYSCSKVTKITLPSGLTTIGAYAFNYCSALSALTIPEKVSSIGDQAFVYCAALPGVTVSASNGYFTSENGVLFNKNKTTLLLYPMKKSGASYTIPSSVKTIANAAFMYCPLTSVSIPSGVTSIGANAFAKAGNLTGITIPSAVSSIGEKAFESCSALKKAEIQNKTAAIGAGAFSGTASGFAIHGYTSSTAQTYANSNGHSFVALDAPARETVASGSCGTNVKWTLYKDGELVISGTGKMTDWSNDGDAPWYSHKNSVKKVTIEKGITSVGDRAFWEYTNLTAVTIPVGVTTVGYCSFYNCFSLASAVLPSSVTTIGDYAFTDCDGLTSLTLPASVTTIGEYAFYGCDGLTTVTIPKNVTKIGSAAFSAGSALTSIRVASDNPNYSASTGGVLFDKNKTTLISYPAGKNGSYSIPNSVTVIGECAFGDSKNLIGLSIPNSLKMIGEYAFYVCDGLTTVTIPEGVTQIESGAFWKCSELSTVTVLGKNVSFGTEVFDGCVSTLKIYAYASSSAQTYANNNGHVFIAIEEPETTPAETAPPETTPAETTPVETAPPDTTPADTAPETDAPIEPEREITASGDCGDSMKWMLYGDGTLFVDGTGATWSWEDAEDVPWDHWRVRIFTVIIADGVTEIGDYAFCGCTNLTEVALSESLETIGKRAFKNCESLEEITISESVTGIGRGAFDGTSEDFVIRGVWDSEAQSYAEENDIPFEEIEEEKSPSELKAERIGNAVWIIFAVVFIVVIVLIEIFVKI